MIDAFLQLKNADDQPVEGESTDAGFERAIEIRDFTLGDRASYVKRSFGGPDGDGGEQLGDAMADAQKSLMDQLKVAAEENRKRQEKREEIRQKAGASFQTNLMQVKSLVTDELLKKTPKVESEDSGADRMSFKIVKDVDAASADLFQAYCSKAAKTKPDKKHRKLGKFTSAEVTLRKMFNGVAKPYFTCTFSDVDIHAYDLSFDSARAHMVETVTFKFVRYKMRYQTQNEDGSVGKANPETSGTVAGKST